MAIAGRFCCFIGSWPKFFRPLAHAILAPFRKVSMLDQKAIEQILPHRCPFLFVDEITDIHPDKRIVGQFHVREEQKFLHEEAGARFFPATLLTEAMAQVGAILVLYPEENRGRTIYFRSIEQTEFDGRVPAGSILRVEAQIRRLRSRFGSLEVSAFVGDERVGKGIMSFALG